MIITINLAIVAKALFVTGFGLTGLMGLYFSGRAILPAPKRVRFEDVTDIVFALLLSTGTLAASYLLAQ